MTPVPVKWLRFQEWVYERTAQDKCYGGVERARSPESNAFPRVLANDYEFLTQRTFSVK